LEGGRNHNPICGMWIRVLKRPGEKIRRAFNKRPGVLFEGSDRCFKEIVSRVRVYAEYGMGKSTVWVLQHTECEDPRGGGRSEVDREGP
jgi:hypothetical protein